MRPECKTTAHRNAPGVASSRFRNSLNEVVLPLVFRQSIARLAAHSFKVHKPQLMIIAFLVPGNSAAFPIRAIREPSASLRALFGAQHLGRPNAIAQHKPCPHNYVLAPSCARCHNECKTTAPRNGHPLTFFLTNSLPASCAYRFPV